MCHKTAGLVANALEEAGIATVTIGTMHKPMEVVPRAIVTRYVHAPIGPPGAGPTHRRIVEQALNLLRHATEHRVESYAPS